MSGLTKEQWPWVPITEHEIERLVNERFLAKERGDWAYYHAIRDELAVYGITIEDRSTAQHEEVPNDLLPLYWLNGAGNDGARLAGSGDATGLPELRGTLRRRDCREPAAPDRAA